MSTFKLTDLEQGLPLLAETSGLDGPEALGRYHAENREAIEAALLDRGAILFRGFGIDQVESHRQAVAFMPGQMLDYVDGNSPRKKLTSGVYTSTEYPPEYFISLHNELSYSEKWPSRLYFSCATEPEEGGETPLADSRAILRNMKPEIAETFAQKGVRYVRNLNGGRGFGPSWQATFETEERAVVEEFCHGSGANFEWRPDGSLRLWHVRPGVASHPKTGERVWFNQADQFHPSTHPPAIYQSLQLLYKGKEENLPQNATFGDGTPITPEWLDEIRTTIRTEIRSFPWRRGDFLMVDNMLVCHGRNPFRGPRKILVAMTDV